MTVATRLLICEDDPRVRQTLTRVAESQADLDVVAAVDRGESAVDVLTTEGADVLVIDVHLPGIDGIEAIRLIRAAGNVTPVIVLSADDRAAKRLDGLEPVRFLSKGSTGALDVLAAIRQANVAS